MSLSLIQLQKLTHGVRVASHFIYSVLTLSLIDVGLGFFPIHPLTSNTFWFGTWIIWWVTLFDESWIGFDTILKCGFEPNSILKANYSWGKGCLPLIYSILALSLADVRLKFFPIQIYEHIHSY